MANERVLIIDNNIQMVDLLTSHVLAPNDYQSLVATDGQVGLEMILAESPDLVLLEMNAPKRSGHEILETLNEQGITTPVIVMTFHGSEALAVQAFRLGVKDYVLKPFEPVEMLEAIERALTEVRLRRERDQLMKRLVASNRTLEKRLTELNTLFSIGKSVTSVLDQDKILARLVEAAIYLTNAEESSLMLLDKRSNELYMMATCGIDKRMARSFRLKVNDSLAGEVMTSGQPLILSGKDLTQIKTAYLVRSLVYVPLKSKGRILGVLSVSNRHQARDFNNHDLRLLSALADYAAISLENARLFEQIEAERAKLATLLGEIEEPVAIVSDKNDQVVLANYAFQNLFGLDSSVIEASALINSIENQALQAFITTGQQSDSSRKMELELDDGRTMNVSLIPVPNIGRAIVMQDISHLKDLDKFKAAFVDHVSHDLRSPLTSMKGYSQMLALAGEVNEKQRLFISRILTSVDRLVTITDNVIDLGMIDLESADMMVPLDLVSLSAEVIAELQDSANKKRQKLVYHHLSSSVWVLGRQARLKQAIRNLVENAIKFTPQAGQISIIIKVEDQQALFKVEDSGLGISAADQPFVFDKFYRVREGIAAQIEPKGTGLGLALCKSIIEKHGGKIWLKSRLKQGSSFTFTLPFAPRDQPNALSKVMVSN